MKKTGTLLLTAFLAAMIAACGGTAENKPANANANTGAAQPVTVAMLKDLDVKAYEAYKNKDTKYFETFLDRNFVQFDNGQKSDKAAALKGIGEHKEEIKGFTFSDEKLTKLGPTTAVLTMKVVTDGTRDGKKIPDAISSTLFTRIGTDWRAAWHGEVDIKTPPAADGPPAANTGKTNPTGAAPAKTDEKPKAENKAEDKKPEAPAKEPAKPADKPANAANTAAAPAGETEALLALEKSGWEAWKAKDWTKLGTMLVNDATFVNVMGLVTFGKDATIKGWTDANCDVKSVALSDASSVTVDGSTSMLVVKGSPTGTCGTEKLAPVWAYGIYVKEGSSWKLGFHFEQPAK
ncbi:MAG: nuclear transport factor 2 family protein [Chloracidobacterium sp.]|nr:nuclear transport factor 2 family protein [Chloracidobacterium sp.]